MRKRSEVSGQSVITPDSAEPVGIVISNGARHEDTPRFAAYVWGAVPETDRIEELSAVA